MGSYLFKERNERTIIGGTSVPSVYGEGGCFVAGTLVATPNGPVPIESLSAGSPVLSFDEQGNIEEDVVDEVLFHPNEPVLSVRFWRGSFEVTPIHWVLNQYYAFAEIGTLTPDDALIDIAGHVRPFISAEEKGYAPVWNLHVRKNRTFIANGIRVHNGGGGKGGGGGGHTPTEAPNTLRSNSIARVLDLICEGPIKGLVDGGKSIYLDNTPLENTDGSTNFKGFSWQMRLGSRDQDYIDGYPVVETEVNVNTELKYNSPIVRVIDDKNVDAVIIKVRVNSLSKQSMETGDISGTSVSGIFEYSIGSGAWQRAGSWSISGKTMSAYERQYRIPLPAVENAVRQIRVTRSTRDSASATLNNATFFSSMTWVIDAKMTYPDTCYLGARVDASQFGSSVPSRAYEIYGLLIRVPSNYDPETRKYTGIWDGTFKLAYSNNPAWVFYDLLTHGRYGLGRELGEERADKWGLYAIAQYCDELVPDGHGGFEPRFVFNGTIHQREDAIKVLSTLAGAFSSIIFYAGDRILLAQDKPVSVEELGPRIAPANVINGLFTYEGTSFRSRHSVALATWLNPDESYVPTVYVHEDPEMIKEFGWKQVDIVAFGCTSEGQAARWAAMTLDTERNATETVSFGMGLDGRYINPGDVVPIADPSHAGVRAGGRLLAVGPTKARLDAPFPFEADESYELAVIYADNTVAQLPIINPGMETNEVEFVEEQTRVPGIGSVFIVVATNVNPRLFRILSVTEGEGLTLNFVGLLYDETKYKRVEEGIDIPKKPTTLLPTGPIQPPHSLNLVEFLRLDGSSVISVATLSWLTEDPRIAGYEVQWQPPSVDYYSGQMVTLGMTMDLLNVERGLYRFQVRSFDVLGRYSVWVDFEHDMIGMYAPPGDVTGFLAVAVATALQLTWDPVLDLDLDHYELRYSPSQSPDVTWDSAVLFGTVPKGTTIFTAPLRSGTYLIKAVDLVGVYSINAAVIVTEASDYFFGMNVVADLTQEDPWRGIKEDTVVRDINGNKLVLQQAGTGFDFFDLTDFFDDEDFFGEQGCYYETGYYYFDPQFFDLGGIYPASLLFFDIEANGYSADIDFFSVDDFFDPEDFFDRVEGLWAVTIEYQATLDNPASVRDFFDTEDFFSDDDFFIYTAQWSEWEPLMSTDVRYRGFRFRLKLESFACNVTPLVNKVVVRIDMPDRLWSNNDYLVTDDPRGTKLFFEPPFLATPAIVITLQDADEGDNYIVYDKSRFGYTIKVFDKNGVQISRLIDGIYKGYGSQVDYVPIA